MKRLLALSAITIITGCTSWSTQDRALGATSMALDAVDYLETKKCLQMTTCHESNPLIGEHPSDGKLFSFKAGMAAAKLAIADAFPQSRTNILRILDVIQLGVDIHNAKIVGFKFGF